MGGIMHDNKLRATKLTTKHGWQKEVPSCWITRLIFQRSYSYTLCYKNLAGMIPDASWYTWTTRNRSNLLSNPSANFPTQTALISFACWGLFISVCLRVASGMSTKNHAKHMFTYRLKLNTLAGLLHWLWWGKGLNGYIQNCNHKTQHQLYHPLFLSFFYPLKLHLYFSFLSFPQTPWKPLTPRCCPRWMSFLTKQRQGPNLACRNLQ